MRHFFTARPVATLSCSMAAPARSAVLVALSGALDGSTPGLPGTASGTVNLAAVAAAADQRLGAAAGAQKQPRWCSVGVTETAIATWTTAAIAGILSLHACPARCRARRRCGTAKSRSAPCLPFDNSKLLRATRPDSQPAADQRNADVDSGNATFSSAWAARLKPLCPEVASTGESDPEGISRPDKRAFWPPPTPVNPVGGDRPFKPSGAVVADRAEQRAPLVGLMSAAAK
jgi:hypothetical protein